MATIPKDAILTAKLAGCELDMQDGLDGSYDGRTEEKSKAQPGEL